MRIQRMCVLVALLTVATACARPPDLPFDEAAKRGQLHAVKWHVRNGEDVNQSIFGRTPLHVAAMNGHDDVVRFLLSKGANVNSRTATGEAPLGWARGNRQDKVPQILIRRGAKI